MDKNDEKILEILKMDGRITVSDISRKINLSVPAVAERIRKLEQSKTIEKYLVRLNRMELGYTLLAFISVTLDKTENISRFREKIITCPNVLECHHIAGQGDYLLKVLVKNTLELENFLMNELKKIPGVISSNTTICLSTLKEELNV